MQSSLHGTEGTFGQTPPGVEYHGPFEGIPPPPFSWKEGTKLSMHDPYGWLPHLPPPPAPGKFEPEPGTPNSYDKHVWRSRPVEIFDPFTTGKSEAGPKSQFFSEDVGGGRNHSFGGSSGHSGEHSVAGNNSFSKEVFRSGSDPFGEDYITNPSGQELQNSFDDDQMPSTENENVDFEDLTEEEFKNTYARGKDYLSEGGFTRGDDLSAENDFEEYSEQDIQNAFGGDQNSFGEETFTESPQMRNRQMFAEDRTPAPRQNLSRPIQPRPTYSTVTFENGDTLEIVDKRYREPLDDDDEEDIAKKESSAATVATGDSATGESAANGESTAVQSQSLPPPEKRQLKEEFMRDREQLEKEMNAKGDSIYRRAGDPIPEDIAQKKSDRRYEPQRRVMTAEECRAHMALEKIAKAAIKAQTKRGTGKGKKGPSIVFI